MQIVPFPAHYQSVYTNFDISSFSLISCKSKSPILSFKIAEVVRQKTASGKSSVHDNEMFLFVRPFYLASVSVGQGRFSGMG